MASNSERKDDLSLISKALIAEGTLAEEKLEQLREEYGFLTKKILVSNNVVTEEEINIAIANYFGLEVLKTINIEEIPKELYENVPYAFAKKHCVLPIRKCGSGSIVVAINDPLGFDLLDHLRFLLSSEINPTYAPAEIINKAIDVCYERGGELTSRMIASLAKEGEKDEEEEEGVYDLLEDKEQAPVIKLLYLILSEAISQNASDIHFEPFEDSLRVRYRIDGVLQKRHAPAHEYQAALITRIKVMAKLDIAERRLPQDGRIKLRMGGREISFRVSSLPVSGGERVVLRILDKGNVMLGLEQIGMPSQMLKRFRDLISLPEGIILVTGPTGSGKTTTLYSALGEVYSDKLNIMTIEDPVEYKIGGIAQIAVRHKINLTFSAGLRSILRQDPDVVMVGEIRDTETAAIAVQASLTGHLVLSTLHTNDAPSAITRLVDMDIEPYLLASSLAGVIAQRLVRRVCAHCKKPYKPTEEELLKIGLTKKDLKGSTIYKGKGCKKCFDTGYHGRHGAYELMIVTDKMKNQITVNQDATQIRKLALEEGMIPLRLHGAELVKHGITTIEEVLRIAKGATLDE